MGSSKTALAVPPKLSDYPAGSYLLTGIMITVILMGWVFTWVLQVLFSYTVGLMLTKHRLQYYNGLIFRAVAARLPFLLTPGVAVTVTPDSWKPTKEYVNGKKSLLACCNHRSFMDPFALGTALYPLETKYVAKGDLFNVPFGGWAMRRAGDLAVKFDPKRNAGWGVVKGATGQLLLDVAEQLTHGNSVAFFPEGTRMGFCEERAAKAAIHESKLMEFKAPIFDVARKTKTPVMCCALKGADDVLPLGSSLFRPYNIKCAIAEPMFGEDYKDEFAFAEAVRSRCGELYQKLCKDYPN